MSAARVKSLRSLASFDSYAAKVQRVALSYFVPHWEEIAQIFGGFYSGTDLKDVLALLLWKYAREYAGKDGSGLRFSKQEKKDIEVFNEAMASIRSVISKVLHQDTRDNLAFLLFRSGFDEPALHELRERSEAFSAAVGHLEINSGGRPSENLPFERLIKEIATMYEWANGHLAIEAVYSDQGREDVFFGGFFCLAEIIEAAAAEATGRKKKSNVALGSILKRVLDEPAEND